MYTMNRLSYGGGGVLLFSRDPNLYRQAQASEIYENIHVMGDEYLLFF